MSWLDARSWTNGVPQAGDTAVIDQTVGPPALDRLGIAGETIMLASNADLQSIGTAARPTTFDGATFLAVTGADATFQTGTWSIYGAFACAGQIGVVGSTLPASLSVYVWPNTVTPGGLTPGVLRNDGAITVAGSGSLADLEIHGGSGAQFVNNGTVVLRGVADGSAPAYTATTMGVVIDTGGTGSFDVDGGVSTARLTPAGFNCATRLVLGRVAGTESFSVADGLISFSFPAAPEGVSFTFNGASAFLQLPDVTTYSPGFSLYGFQAGDAIGLGTTAVTEATYDAATGMVELAGDDGAGNLAGRGQLHMVATGTQDYSAANFTIATGLYNSYLMVDAAAPCYCPGTLIATDRGERAVEALAIGDRVMTAAGASEPIRWIGRRGYAGRFLTGRRNLLPVTIRAGALGNGLPRRDLVVSPLHALGLDGVLAPAGLLVNGVTVVQPVRCAQVEYLHIELDRHDLLLAEGAPAESFLDDGSRAMFHNAHDRPQATSAAGYCARRIEHGEKLDAIRRRLNRLAASARSTAA